MKTLADLFHAIVDKIPWFEEAHKSKAHEIVTNEVGPPSSESTDEAKDDTGTDTGTE